MVYITVYMEHVNQTKTVKFWKKLGEKPLKKAQKKAVTSVVTA